MLNILPELLGIKVENANTVRCFFFYISLTL